MLLKEGIGKPPLLLLFGQLCYSYKVSGNWCFCIKLIVVALIKCSRVRRVKLCNIYV